MENCKESKNGKAQPEMDYFDDFQEKDGYESTKPLDVLPNTPIWKFGILWKKIQLDRILSQI